MNFLKRLWQSRRSPNILAYYISGFTTEGQAQASPLGAVPRLSDMYESEIRKKHRAGGSGYINDTLNGISVILFWTGDRVDAISFLSADQAREFPGFKALDANVLAKLDSILTHFPR